MHLTSWATLNSTLTRFDFTAGGFMFTYFYTGYVRSGAELLPGDQTA
jgi:hypothetical protein